MILVIKEDTEVHKSAVLREGSLQMSACNIAIKKKKEEKKGA